MIRPTEDELQEALQEAERLREPGTDPHHLAKTVLYQHRCLTALQAVYAALLHYRHTGMAEHSHGRLVRTLEETRAAEAKETEGEAGSLWLE